MGLTILVTGASTGIRNLTAKPQIIRRLSPLNWMFYRRNR